MESYLNYKPVSITESDREEGQNQGNMKDAGGQVVEYAGEDADITLQLREKFAPMLDEERRDLLDKAEMPLIPVLGAMEMEGINLDVEVNSMSKELESHDQTSGRFTNMQGSTSTYNHQSSWAMC